MTIRRRQHPFVASALLAAVLALGASRPAAADWPHAPGSSAVLCGAAGSQQYPSVASDGLGGAIVAWDDSRAGGTVLYAQRFDRYGRELWAPGGIRVSTAENYGVQATVAADGAGGVVIGWYSVDGPCVQRLDASGNRLWGPGGVKFVPAFLGGRALIAPDGAGNFVACWYDTRNGNLDVYAQKLSASGVEQWGASEVAVCTATGSQGPYAIVADGTGGTVLAWSDGRGAFQDVYAQRLDANGTPRWTVNGVSVASALPAQRSLFYSCAVADGAGGVILAWVDERNDFGDVYAQRLDGFGGRRWGADGTPVVAAPNTQYDPAVTTDGQGGAIFAWSDFRGANVGIYAQRADGSGAMQWPANGVLLASGANLRYNVSAVADGQGGAFVGWRDFRANPNGAMYARRVDALGVPGWTADGVRLGAAGFETSSPPLAASEGGVIGVWFHNRGDGADVVGQRVDRHGYLGAPEPRIAGVRDVPNDQGGKVKVSWDASWLDTDPSQIVQSYLVLRSVPPGVAAEQLARGGRAAPLARITGEPGALWTTLQGAQTYYWELIGSTSALHFVSGYSYLAPTTGDSTGAFNPSTAFMVVAQNYSGQYWLSAPDSGYSVDDLAPAAPAPFTAEYGAGITRLHWSPNGEADLAGYRLYRGESPGFVPGPANLVSAQPDTGYADAVGALRWYKLTALDVHGNESPVAIVSPTALAGAPGEGAAGLAFAAPSPNPARIATTLRLALPRDGAVRLAVYDAGGRLVRTLRDGPMAAGAHAVSFDLRDDAGRALPAGLYLARFEAEGRSFVRRVAITR